MENVGEKMKPRAEKIEKRFLGWGPGRDLRDIQRAGGPGIHPGILEAPPDSRMFLPGRAFLF